MKVNFRIESSAFCYVFSKYKIVEINGKRYILPEENATKRTISITENIDELLISVLNIGKKVLYNESLEDVELLNFYSKYGSFGFMIDLAISKYFIFEDKVAIRDSFYINNKENVDFMNVAEYLKFFLPKLNKKEITKLIKNCKDVVSDTKKESYLTSIINEYLIYNENYAEPIELVLNYARSLYKTLSYTLDNKNVTMDLHFLNANHITSNIRELYFNNSFGITINYLKQAIDIAYSMQMAQDVRLLKVCNFCNKAFIANNPKAEYDTPQCKNKANVYKSRNKSISKNVIQTEKGIMLVNDDGTEEQMTLEKFNNFKNK